MSPENLCAGEFFSGQYFLGIPSFALPVLFKEPEQGLHLYPPENSVPGQGGLQYLISLLAFYKFKGKQRIVCPLLQLSSKED